MFYAWEDQNINAYIAHEDGRAPWMYSQEPARTRVQPTLTACIAPNTTTTTTTITSPTATTGGGDDLLIIQTFPNDPICSWANGAALRNLAVGRPVEAGQRQEHRSRWIEFEGLHVQEEGEEPQRFIALGNN